jgi:hypothetical protein
LSVSPIRRVKISILLFSFLFQSNALYMGSYVCPSRLIINPARGLT